MSGPDAFSHVKKEDEKHVVALEAFSVKLFHQAAYGADEIRKLAEDKTIEQRTYGLELMQWFAVCFEFQNFYLHMADRLAFSRLSESRRSQVMADLEHWSVNRALETICSGWPEDKIREIQEESLANVRSSHEEFGQYKRMFPNPGESPAGTLIWEFGKSVANCAGRLTDIAYISRSEQLATEGLIALDIKSFIAQFN